MKSGGNRRRQQIERLRYHAGLAERQYNQTDPDNRLVAAELERRWEAALRDLKDAEERFRHEQQQPRAPEGLGPEERDAFLQAGKTIPDLWRQDLLSPQLKKAFLRSLIDKVVVHRSAPDTLQVRIVWRGGDTTTTSLPVTVGSLSRLSTAEAISVITSGLALATHFGDGVLRAADVAGGITGAVIQDPESDRVAWQEYLETVVRERDDWSDFYRACREAAG